MSRSSASSMKGAGGFVRRAEHQLVDQKLRPSVEQLGERLLSVLGVEGVLLLDRDPGQLLSLLRHLNFDFDFAFTQEQMATGELAKMVAEAPDWLKDWAENVGTDLASGMAESPGWNVFKLEDGVVYHTYSRTAPDRFMLAAYYSQLLDQVPDGRDADFPLRRHDEY